MLPRMNHSRTVSCSIKWKLELEEARSMPTVPPATCDKLTSRQGNETVESLEQKTCNYSGLNILLGACSRFSVMFKRHQKLKGTQKTKL